MAQLMLFETDSKPQADGSLLVRPRRLITGREIDARKAAEILGFRDRETVFRLIERGELAGWKPDSRRGNGKYRIDLESVYSYKARRIEQSRRGA